MSLTTILRPPGKGRRQADPNARLAAANRRLHDDNQQLQHRLEGAGWLIEALRAQLADADAQRLAEVADVARVLGEHVRDLFDEQQAHARTQQALDIAVRANAANAGATTVETDVSVLRAAVADQYVEAPDPGPEYGAHRSTVSAVIRVVPLWSSPQAAHPAAVPPLAGAA